VCDYVVVVIRHQLRPGAGVSGILADRIELSEVGESGEATAAADAIA
jgi:hypothetical protein